MGFLDQSTNNIILDAVLTDQGRQALARNDGSFNIFKFSFGDDEVDYSHIVSFGRTVGKEKIEKNTPVLEATTQSSQGLKHKLVSLNNPSLTKLPILSLVTSLDDNTLSLVRSASSSTGDSTGTIQIQQYMAGGATVDPDVADFSFRIICDYGFLKIMNAVPNSVDDNGIAEYIVEANAVVSAQNLTTLTFSAGARNMSNDAFVAASADGTNVYRPIQIYGMNSGAGITIQVKIT